MSLSGLGGPNTYLLMRRADDRTCRTGDFSARWCLTVSLITAPRALASQAYSQRHAMIDRISVRLHNMRTDDTAGSHRANNAPKPERQGCIDMHLWYQVAALSVGGVLGVNARYWLGVLINRWAGSQFPWSTFTINITGSFAIGLCTVFLDRWAPHAYSRLVVVVGFLGGYTTFSAYSFESLALWERGERMLCLVYMFGSVAGGFAGVVLGTALGRGLTK
jgi:fluoride exporter